MIRSTLTASACLSVLALAPTQMQAAVIANGSFESATVPVETNLDDATSTGVITGWTLDIDPDERMRYEDNFFGFLAPSDGNRQLAFNNGDTTPGAAISQTFATVIGTTYEVLFDVGAVDGGGGGLPSFVVGLQASVDNTAGTSLDVSTPLSAVTGGSAASSGGDYFATDSSLIFTADSTTTTLTFLDISQDTDSADVLLDNVRISVIPEPASLALLGLGGLLIAARRRRDA